MTFFPKYIELVKIKNNELSNRKYDTGTDATDEKSDWTNYIVLTRRII